MTRKIFFLSIQIWMLVLLVVHSSNFAYASVSEPTVCIYYKHIDPQKPEEGFYFKVMNNASTSDVFQVLYSKRNKSYYLDFGQESSGRFSSRIVLQDFKAQVGRFFSTFSRGKLSSLSRYKMLIEYVTDGGRLLKSIDLGAYGINDNVYAFNFDALGANIELLKSPQSSEALALYNFAQNHWEAGKTGLDYKAQLLRTDFSVFTQEEKILRIFEVEAPSQAPKPVFTESDRAVIRSADTKATWAIILAAIGVIVVIYLVISVMANLRRRASQISRIEAKLKHLEGKLNRPFYQVDNLQGETQAQQGRLDALVSRIEALERSFRGSSPAVKDKRVQNMPPKASMTNSFAKKVQGVLQKYQAAWLRSSPMSDSEISRKVLQQLSNLESALSKLDGGMSAKQFVQKYLIVHIDLIDSLFQPEPDATIKTPEPIQAYIADLLSVTDMHEVDIQLRSTRFDEQTHEKVGAILKTNLAPETIIKVIRRGLIFENMIRKAQVIKAE